MKINIRKKHSSSLKRIRELNNFNKNFKSNVKKLRKFFHKHRDDVLNFNKIKLFDVELSSKNKFLLFNIKC